MAMSASSMASQIQGFMNQTTVTGAGGPAAYQQAMLLALCKGIIAEITANMVVPSTGNDANGVAVTVTSTKGAIT